MNSEDVVSFVLRRNLPLVVFDSCALLDIPRLKYGPKTSEVINLCANSGQDKYTYLMPMQVVREIDRNLPIVVSESINNIRQAMTLLVAVGIVDNHLESSVQQKCDLLKSSINDIIFQSTKLDDSEEVFYRAMNRLIMQKRPAHSSKSSYGDCLILESLLECSSLLRRGGFKKDILFITTNPEDFSSNQQERKCEPHQDFASDFLRLKIVYLTDLRPMLYESGLQKLKMKQINNAIQQEASVG